MQDADLGGVGYYEFARIHIAICAAAGLYAAVVCSRDLVRDRLLALVRVVIIQIEVELQLTNLAGVIRLYEPAVQAIRRRDAAALKQVARLPIQHHRIAQIEIRMSDEVVLTLHPDTRRVVLADLPIDSQMVIHARKVLLIHLFCRLNKCLSGIIHLLRVLGYEAVQPMV